MMQRVLNQASRSIASGAVILGLAGLLSRVLGVYRDRLLATTFGAGPSLDAYYAAFRVPDFVFNLLVLGALSAGFIPIFSEYLKKNKEQAWKLAQSVLMMIFILLLAVCIILFIAAPWLVSLITPGFSEELVQTTIKLTRIMLLSPLLLGLSAVFGGVLQSFKRFLAYSLAPILYNLGIIAGIFLFVEPMGIEGLAWGVVLGAGAHLFMQLYITYRLGWRFSFTNIWQKKGIREIVRLMGPRTLSLVILQINLLVITIFATRLSEGSVTIFNFANNLAHVPIGLFGISFAVSAFPVLSQYAAEKRDRFFDRTIFKTTSQILFFLMPALIVILLLDEQIVRLVYGAGEFDWNSTLRTARTLLFFLPGILAQAIIPLLTRAFYAEKDTKHPLYAAMVGFILTIILAGILPGLMLDYPVSGLSLAFSLASVGQLLLLMYYLKVKTDDEIRFLIHTIWQTIIASAFMFFIIQVIKELTGTYLDLLTVKGVLLHFLLPAAAGYASYLIVLGAVDNDEFMYYEQAFKGKLRIFEKAFVPTVGAGEEDDITL
jgi:putative peptidoglycan lipid II flippase